MAILNQVHIIPMMKMKCEHGVLLIGIERCKQCELACCRTNVVGGWKILNYNIKRIKELEHELGIK